MFNGVERFANRFADGKGKFSTFALNITSGLALIAASAWFVNNMLATRDAELPPRVVNSIVIEPTNPQIGQPFKAHINVTLNRLCPYEVHWSLIRATDNVEVVRVVEPVKVPPPNLGTQDLPVANRWIPSSVTSGVYVYASDVIDLCPDGHTYTSVRKNVRMDIREPD